MIKFTWKVLWEVISIDYSLLTGLDIVGRIERRTKAKILEARVIMQCILWTSGHNI